ncbi:MAG: ExbD/TolR family protein [Pseudomonadota bacterium]
MAFGRLERGPRPAPMSEINMTPLIDVMLVLLVIFMLTAPLMASSLKLDLPSTEAAQPDTPDGEVVELALTTDGRLHWADDVVQPAELDRRLRQVAQRNPRQEVQLRADRAVPYGRVAELIGALQQAGLSRIAFVAEPGVPAASAAR